MHDNSGRHFKKVNSAGTAPERSHMPPPTPSRPARRPAMTPVEKPTAMNRTSGAWVVVSILLVFRCRSPVLPRRPGPVQHADAGRSPSHRQWCRSRLVIFATLNPGQISVYVGLSFWDLAMTDLTIEKPVQLSPEGPFNSSRRLSSCLWWGRKASPLQNQILISRVPVLVLGDDRTGKRMAPCRAR